MCSKQNKKCECKSIKYGVKHESSKLIKHISCKCRCKFDGEESNLNQKWSIYKCRWKCKYQWDTYGKKAAFGILPYMLVSVMKKYKIDEY